MKISKSIRLHQLKESIALFCTFTGDTHFLTCPYDKVISDLNSEARSRSELLMSFLNNNEFDNVDATKEFNQFVTEAINSGIISE